MIPFSADAERFDPDRRDLLMGVERKPGYREAAWRDTSPSDWGVTSAWGTSSLAPKRWRRRRFVLALDRPRLLGDPHLHITWYERTLDQLAVEVG